MNHRLSDFDFFFGCSSVVMLMFVLFLSRSIISGFCFRSRCLALIGLILFFFYQ